MKIFVQAKDMRVTQAIRLFVTDKVRRNIGKLGLRVNAVKVYLENVARKKNDPQSSQVKVKIEIPGKDIVTKNRSHDLYQATTGAIKSGARQLRKLKEKRKNKTRN